MASVQQAYKKRHRKRQLIQIAGIATASAGLVTLGFGVRSGLKAQTIEDELDNIVWSSSEDDRVQDGRNADRTMKILTGIGAGAVGAGVVVYYLAARAAHQDVQYSGEPGVLSGRTLRISGLVVLGFGATMTAVGIKAGLNARSVSQDLDDELARGGIRWNVEYEARWDRANADQRTMYALCGAGVTALATGSMMYLLGRRSDKDERTARRSVSLAPQFTVSSATLTFTGEF